MSGFLERLAGRLRAPRDGVRPYVPPRFAPEEVPEPELELEAAPVARETAATGTPGGAATAVARPAPTATLFMPAAVQPAEAPVIARYASSLPPPTPAPAPTLAPASISAPGELLVPIERDAEINAAPSASAAPLGSLGPPTLAAPAPLDAPLVDTSPANAPSAPLPPTAAASSSPAAARARDTSALVPRRATPPRHEDPATPADAAAQPVMQVTPPTRTLPAARSDAAPAPSTVHVTIGRIDVRAVLPTPGARLPSPAPKPPISLDEYLRQRDRGER